MNNSSEPINVCWIASYPKSGNTWLMIILRNLFINLGLSNDSKVTYSIFNYQKGGNIREIPLIPGSMTSLDVNEVCFMKSHSASDKTVIYKDKNGNQPFKTVGFISIYRHPLDIILSYINFFMNHQNPNNLEQISKKKFYIDFLGFSEIPSNCQMKLDEIPQENLDHALKIFSQENGIPLNKAMASTYELNVNSWLQVANQEEWINKSVILKYENAKNDPFQEFGKLRKLINFEDEHLINALNCAEKSTSKGKPFFNKRTYGYYKNYFSQDAIDIFYQKKC